MTTSVFWEAADRLGTNGAPLIHWRAALGDEFERVVPHLKRRPLVADWICDPVDPTKRLAIYPSGEDGYIAESEVSPPHREAFEIPASDVMLHGIEWAALAQPLSTALGFIPLPRPEGTGQIRRIGFVQRKGSVTPVHVFLPAGTGFDATGFIHEMADLRDAILHVPTVRWLSADVMGIASRQCIEVRILASLFAVDANERGTLHTARKPKQGAKLAMKLKAILDVQPGWRWEDLSIRLTDNGTLLASYGRHRGRYRFEKRGDDVSKTFATFARLAWQGEWVNPRSGEHSHERLRKRFNRLRDTLTDLIPIPGDPFQLDMGVWKPVFRLEMDAELQAILTSHGNRKPTNGDLDDEENEPDSE